MAKKPDDIKAPLGTAARPIKPEIIARIFGGRMLSEGYLSEELIEKADSGDPEHRIDDDEVKRLFDEVKAIITEFKPESVLNEDETQDEIIYPILNALEWRDRTVKKDLNMDAKERRQVPDGLLFMNEADKKSIFEPANEKRPYKFGKLVLENKRWHLPLEDAEGRFSAPAIQILSYLNRAFIVSDKKIQWGVLTNGIEWRLYYQQAQSVSEQFFAVYLDRLFGIDETLFKIEEEEQLACFKIFLLMFCKQSFQPVGIEGKDFHLSVLEGVKLHQERITENMADEIFSIVYEKLARAIAADAPNASGDEIRSATLKILFRILFILYAEDRDLLPMENNNYKQYSLRHTMRMDIFELPVSEQTTTYWCIFKSLCSLINNGEPNFDVPKYNGGLFKDDLDLFRGLEIRDTVMLEIIRPLSHFGKTYINYKNLNVEQLGSIYEQLLELAVVKGEGQSDIVISGYERKNSGSYYTPQELVSATIKEAIDPLYEKHMHAFDSFAVDAIDSANPAFDLKQHDPAEMILAQKACDPSMGSGHFLVTLTDFLTDQVIKAMGQAETMTPEEWHYQSPLRNSIEEIRQTIRKNAEKGGYKVNEEHLKDRHIIKRMVLKKSIYGVDKNPMAVELAKLSLWLHTFTVGAPLSFLDHHLKCGDSLFGLSLKDVKNKMPEGEGTLFGGEKIKELMNEASINMEEIGNLTDAEIEQVKQSEIIYNDIEAHTKPIKKLFSFFHTSDWLANSKFFENKNTSAVILAGLVEKQFGDPIEAVNFPDKVPMKTEGDDNRKDFLRMAAEAEQLSKEEHFFHWQVEFPEVWQYNNGTVKGGFDIIVGNPPWDKMRFQKVEWFADRNVDVAKSGTKAKRDEKITALEKSGDPLYKTYEWASKRAAASSAVLRKAELYKELNKGILNIYKIFIERSWQLISENGYVSLVVPSGIASDEASAPFFRELANNKQIISFYDFENGRTTYNSSKPKRQKLNRFFKDVHPSYKFCIFTHAKFANADTINYGCFLQQASDIDDPEKCFPMQASYFELMNPNTGTAPLFRSEKDRDLVISVYKNHPILNSQNDSVWQSEWNIKQYIMLGSSDDSGLFKDEKQLKKLEAYPIDNNQHKNKDGIWLPLYKGAMMHLHDHRASNIINNPENMRRQLQPVSTTTEQHQDPSYFPKPYYWVLENKKTDRLKQGWTVGFRKLTASTNERTIITSILPKAAYEDTAPTLRNDNKDKKEYLLCANFNSIPFDYIARQKIHLPAITWVTMQQLPVIDLPIYNKKRFGNKTAEEVIKEIVLELNYTAYNLKAFAEDLDYTGEPFEWNENRRLSLMAKLDAIYFILYGITDDEDIKYIYSTFKKTKEEQEKQFQTYKTCDLCIDYKNALLNNDPNIFY